jgi:hypothetical protein
LTTNIIKTQLSNRSLVEIYQLYLPSTSQLKSITLDNQPLSMSGITAQSEVGLDRYQFPVVTTLNSQHQVVIDFEYLLPEPVKLPIALSLTELRQVSSRSDGVELEINYPQSIKPSAITSEVVSKQGKIIYRFPKKNSTFAVHFVPNQVQ